MRRKKKPLTPPEPDQFCDVDGCHAPGTHKAPKSRGGDDRQYFMFCMDHIREFNKSYDYFQGMDEDGIVAFMKDAVLGHRPTWKLGKGPSFSDINVENGFRKFFDDIPVQNEPSPVPPKIRDALGVFSLNHPVEQGQVKQQYKKLVKRYHPDINKTAKAEEKFKQITESYQLLIEHYEDSV